MKTPLSSAFLEYHKKNPWVYEQLRAMALEAKAEGYKNYGIASLIEVLRWHSRKVTADNNKPFKIPNAHRTFYARLLMDCEPCLRGFFKTTESVAD